MPECAAVASKHPADAIPGKGAHLATAGHPSKVRAAFQLVTGESLSQGQEYHGQGEAGGRARGSQGWSWCSQGVGLQPGSSSWVWGEVGTPPAAPCPGARAGPAAGVEGL